jgi:hypothetical protein
MGEDIDPVWAKAAPLMAQKVASVQAIRKRFMFIVSSEVPCGGKCRLSQGYFARTQDRLHSLKDQFCV